MGPAVYAGEGPALRRIYSRSWGGSRDRSTWSTSVSWIESSSALTSKRRSAFRSAKGGPVLAPSCQVRATHYSTFERAWGRSMGGSTRGFSLPFSCQAETTRFVPLFQCQGRICESFTYNHGSLGDGSRTRAQIDPELNQFTELSPEALVSPLIHPAGAWVYFCPTLCIRTWRSPVSLKCRQRRWRSLDCASAPEHPVLKRTTPTHQTKARSKPRRCKAKSPVSLCRLPPAQSCTTNDLIPESRVEENGRKQLRPSPGLL